MSSDSDISSPSTLCTEARRTTLLALPTELLLHIFSYLSSDYASLLFLPKTCRRIRQLTLPSAEHPIHVPTSSKLSFLLAIEKSYPRYLNTHFSCSYCTHILPRSAFGDCQSRIPPRVRDYERRGSMICLQCTSDVYPDLTHAPPRVECGRPEEIICSYCRMPPPKGVAYCDHCQRYVPCASKLRVRHSHTCWKCERWNFPRTGCMVRRRRSWRQETVPVVYAYGFGTAA